MTRRISQREARKLKKRVQELEHQESVRMRSWSSEYPGGINIDYLTVQSVEYVAIKTAWMLGHPVIVKPGQENQLIVYALRKP